MSIFGKQLQYATEVLDAHRHLFDAGFDAEAVEKRAQLASDYARVIMQVVVSGVVLIGGMMLLFKGNEPTQKIASGLIGTVLGYWLR